MHTDLLVRLQPFGALQGEDDCAAYESGARSARGKALCVVRPSSEAEVSELVRLVAAAGCPLIVQGANTGLVGASTPDGAGRTVVLSTERLRGMHALSFDDRTVRVAAGTRLSELNDWLAPYGLWFPIDLGADPSIGGMVATNTGGTRMVRYGDTRARVAALRVVLVPSGECLQAGRGLDKDNTGIELKYLFIGSSGSLGLVTEATLRLAPLPVQSETALLVPESINAVPALWQRLDRALHGLISAFEGISSTALRLALEHLPSLRSPFETLPDYSILLELSSPLAPGVLDLRAVLERALEGELGSAVTNAIIGRADDLWRLRHALSDGLRAAGKVVGFDVSLPRESAPCFIASARALVAKHLPAAQVADFGHWGDGGMHFNLVLPRELGTDAGTAIDDLRAAMYRLVVNEFAGSFSAEHGVGPTNVEAWRRHTPEGNRRIAQALQVLFDPSAMLGRVRFEAGA